jgi:hypothetical protein
VDGDLNSVLGVDRKVISVLLCAVSKQRDIRIVPCNGLIELHQEELTINARVGPIDNALGNVETGISSFRGLEKNDVQLAQAIEYSPTVTPTVSWGIDGFS